MRSMVEGAGTVPNVGCAASVGVAATSPVKDGGGT